MSSPILHGTALCPLLRFPSGGMTKLRVVMDTDLNLGTGVDDILFAVRARYGSDSTPIRITRSGTAAAWTASSPNTTTISLAPDAEDETADSTRTLADLHEASACAWRMDFLDEAGVPIARLQGDLEYLPEDGDWTDEPASTATLPSLTVNLVNGAVTVTVSLISEGATVDNAAVVAAIEEDPAAARTALELGSAATEDTSAFAAASHGHAIGDVTNLQTALDGKAAASHGHAIGDVTGLQTALDATVGTAKIQDAAVTNAKLSNMAAGTIKGRPVGAGTGVPVDLTAAEQKTVIEAALASGGTINFNGPISTGASERAVSGLWSRTGYEYFSGAGIGIGNLLGTMEIAVGNNNRIRFVSSSTNVFVGGGACLQPLSGGIEINDGTRSSFADLTLRDLIASRYLRPGSYTVAAANALVSPPDGALILVSNEAGGSTVAQRARGAWRRIYDDAAIS